MKKILFLMMVLAVPDTRAEKICALTGLASWNSSTFAEATPGWPGDPDKAYMGGGLGDIASGVTWRVKHVRDGKTTIVMGRHKCSALSNNIHAITNEDGQYCHCQRTHIDNVANEGPWVLRIDLLSVANCNSCNSHCSGFGGNARYISLIMAPNYLNTY